MGGCKRVFERVCVSGSKRNFFMPLCRRGRGRVCLRDRKRVFHHDHTWGWTYRQGRRQVENRP